MWENCSYSAHSLFTTAPIVARAGERVLPILPVLRLTLRVRHAHPQSARVSRVSHMTSARTVTLEATGPMIPSQPPPSKRKATDDANPLAGAGGKKLKREVRHVNMLPRSYVVLTVPAGFQGGTFEQTEA